MRTETFEHLIAVVSKADAAGGGASRVAEDLAVFLNEDTVYPAHHWIGYAGNEWRDHYRLMHGAHKLRFVQRAVSWFSLQAGFPDFFTPEMFIHYLKKADDYSLYHFHDISRTISPIALRWLARRKPVVWTFHDCSPFTGGCLYPMGCEAFTSRCGNCPQLHLWPLKTRIDATGWMQDYKRKTASAGLFVPVAPSNWMADEAYRSGMFRQRPTVIPYAVDSELFQALPKNPLRDELGLPRDRLLVFLSVHNLADERKGVADGIRAIAASGTDPLVIAMGTVEPASHKLFEGIDVRFMGYVSERSEMARFCAASDVLLFPTYADNLPNSVLEALACGTPTVGYATGGMPDMVEHEVNGWLAPTGDIEGLARGLREAWSDRERYRKWSVACREKAETEYSRARFVAAHTRLYESLLQGDHACPIDA